MQHKECSNDTPLCEADQRKQPLEGLKVVDFGHAAAGPYCAHLLSELGATVIKVEPPSGDHFREAQGGAVFANVNRNKRCIALNLKQEDGRKIALELIDHADIVVESFTPGTMDSLGLGYAALKERKPALVYVSISGFGQTGPYRTRPGYDVVAQAMSGLMAATGEATRPPVRVGASMIDFGTGLFAAFGALAAIRQRDADGRGSHVDASLLDTGIGWMNYWFTYFGYTGQVPIRQGSGLTLFAPYQVFHALDGEIFIGVSTDRFFKVFCDEFDLPDLPTDERFISNKTRCANRAEIVEIVQSRLETLTLFDVVARLERCGIPHAPVLDVSDVLKDAHVIERDTFFRIIGTDGRENLMPRLPVRLSDQVRRTPTPAPDFGQDNAAILAELGYSNDDIRELYEHGVIVNSITTHAS